MTSSALRLLPALVLALFLVLSCHSSVARAAAAPTSSFSLLKSWRTSVPLSSIASNYVDRYYYAPASPLGYLGVLDASTGIELAPLNLTSSNWASLGLPVPPFPFGLRLDHSGVLWFSEWRSHALLSFNLTSRAFIAAWPCPLSPSGYAFDVSAQGDRLAFKGDNRTSVYSVQAGRVGALLYSLPSSSLSFAFTADGLLLTADSDYTRADGSAQLNTSFTRWREGQAVDTFRPLGLFDSVYAPLVTADGGLVFRTGYWGVCSQPLRTSTPICAVSMAPDVLNAVMPTTAQAVGGQGGAVVAGNQRVTLWGAVGTPQPQPQPPVSRGRAVVVDSTVFMALVLLLVVGGGWCYWRRRRAALAAAQGSYGGGMGFAPLVAQQPAPVYSQHLPVFSHPAPAQPAQQGQYYRL